MDEEKCECSGCGEIRPICHDNGKNDYGGPVKPTCIDCCGDCESDYMNQDDKPTE